MFKFVTVGGTFDNFHKGHRRMLDRAFEVGEKVYLGITTDKFTKKKASSDQRLASSYKERKKNVENYLKLHNWLHRCKILPLNDRFGTTLTDETLEAIVVSPETELVATEINLLRAQKNWGALEVVLVPWVVAEDGKPVNSVRIRNGEIDREGKLFTLPKEWGVRRLPERLREEFKRPVGKLLSGEEFNRFVKEYRIQNTEYRNFLGSKKFSHDSVFSIHDSSKLLIAVGDAVTKSLLQQGITPDISIIDLRVQRKQIYKGIEDLGFTNVIPSEAEESPNSFGISHTREIPPRATLGRDDKRYRGYIKVHKKIKNPAGTLSYQAFETLKNVLEHKKYPAVLEVDGEEDLLAVMAIFLAPLGSIVLYGQPNLRKGPTLARSDLSLSGQGGVVVVEVTEERKKKMRGYLGQFI